MMAAGSLYGGITAHDSAIRAAKQEIADGEQAAAIKKREVEKFQSEQELAYLKSGVLLDGSPLLVLEDTRREGLADVRNIRESARNRASNLRRQGRSQLFGSFFSAGGQALTGYGRSKSG